MKIVLDWEMTSFGSHGHFDVENKIWLVEVWNLRSRDITGKPLNEKPWYCRIRIHTVQNTSEIRDERFLTLEEAKLYADETLKSNSYKIIQPHLLVLK